MYKLRRLLREHLSSTAHGMPTAELPRQENAEGFGLNDLPTVVDSLS
jgi:hypothetical protein